MADQLLVSSDVRIMPLQVREKVRRTKLMRSLTCVVLITTIASTIMVAQLPQPNPQRDKADPNRGDPAGRVGNPDKPLADKPASQADRPAGQASTSRGVQATSRAMESRTFTGTIVNASCSQANSLTNRPAFADRSASSATS